MNKLTKTILPLYVAAHFLGACSEELPQPRQPTFPADKEFRLKDPFLADTVVSADTASVTDTLTKTANQPPYFLEGLPDSLIFQYKEDSMYALPNAGDFAVDPENDPFHLVFISFTPRGWDDFKSKDGQLYFAPQTKEGGDLNIIARNEQGETYHRLHLDFEE